MRTFELHIFIDCKQDKVYDHLSEPINMIGLQPRLTEIDILKKKKDENGITVHPFNTVETFRWMGFPLFRNKVYSVIHLTKPKRNWNCTFMESRTSRLFSNTNSVNSTIGGHRSARLCAW